MLALTLCQLTLFFGWSSATQQMPADIPFQELFLCPPPQPKLLNRTRVCDGKPDCAARCSDLMEHVFCKEGDLSVDEMSCAFVPCQVKKCPDGYLSIDQSQHGVEHIKCVHLADRKMDFVSAKEYCANLMDGRLANFEARTAYELGQLFSREGLVNDTFWANYLVAWNAVTAAGGRREQYVLKHGTPFVSPAVDEGGDVPLTLRRSSFLLAPEDMEEKEPVAVAVKKEHFLLEPMSSVQSVLCVHQLVDNCHH